MKKLLTILAIIVGISAQAQQDTLRVYLDGKLVWHNTGIQTMNVKQIPITQKHFKKKSALVIEVKSADARPNWQRSFLFNDPSDQPVFNKSFNKATGKFSIPVASLKPGLSQHKTLQLFTVVQPPEGSLMNGIRIERRFMCELVLQ